VTEEQIVIATAKHNSRSKAFMDAGLAREAAWDLADKLFEHLRNGTQETEEGSRLTQKRQEELWNEMTDEEKNQRSHGGQAARLMRELMLQRWLK
jgi:citrate lyase alpha subunit